MAIKKYYVFVSEEGGSTRWYKDANGTIPHRTNGPAVEHDNGSKFWYQYGKLHRTDGPSAEWCDGTKIWHRNNVIHRTDGPAIEWWDGDKSWWQNGQRHRTDGPAVVYADGSKVWYINDKAMTEAEFLAATQPVVEMTVADIENLLGKRVKIIK